MAPARSDTAALPEALGRLHFTVEETETGGVRVTPPGSLRQQVVEVGPSPGHLTAEHLLSPVFPPFPCPRACGSTAQCSCSGTPWGPQPVRRPDSAAGQPCLQALSPHPQGPRPAWERPCVSLSAAFVACPGLTIVPASRRGSLRPCSGLGGRGGPEGEQPVQGDSERMAELGLLLGFLGPSHPASAQFPALVTSQETTDLGHCVIFPFTRVSQGLRGCSSQRHGGSLLWPSRRPTGAGLPVGGKIYVHAGG